MLLKDLFFNLAILLAISVLSGFIDLRFNRSSLRGKIFQGILFGLACVIGMMYPFKLAEGIIFDGRSIILSLAALFFGPTTAIISSVITVIYRLWFVGGQGSVMGLTVIMMSMTTGLAFHFWLKRKNERKLTLGMLYLLGLLVHFFMLLSMFLLPGFIIHNTIKMIGFAVVGVYPVGMVIIGKILLDQQQNKELMDEVIDNEELYFTTIQSVSEGIITTDRDGRIQHMNPVAESLTGWSEKEAMHTYIENVFILVDEIRHEAIQDTIKEVLNTGIQFDSSDHLLLKMRNGEEIPISFRCTRRTNSEQYVFGTVIIFSDLRKERENKLELFRSAESYRGLFNNMTSAIYIQDREGIFLDVNKGACMYYGYEKEEIIGKSPEFLSAPDKNNDIEVKACVEEAFNGKPQQFEFWGKRKNGEIFPKQMNLFKTVYNGKDAVIAFGLDISERKAAERELAKSEERYRSLFNYAPVGIFLIDKKGIIVNVNETYCRQMGYQINELVGNKIDVIVPDEIHDLILPNLQKIFREKALYSRVQNKTKAGELKTMELIENLIVLPNGEEGILSIAMDITEQVKAETTLRISEARNKAIISAIPDLFFRIDKDGNFIDIVVDDPSKLISPPEESIGKNCKELLPPHLAEITLNAIKTTLSTGELIQFVYSLAMQDQTQWFDARVVKSGPDEALAIIRDISERQRAEEEIKQKSNFIETLLDSIPNPLFYMDNKGKYIGINQSFREFYQLENRDIIGKTLFEIDSYDIASTNAASDQLIFEGKESLQVLDRTVRLPNGGIRDVIITKSAFRDSENKIAGLIGMITDITQRKKMEHDLLTAKDKAEESDRLKTAFLNNLSHEIRTPLNAIVGFSELLGDDYTDEQKTGFIEIINNNSDQLLHIIDDVLSVSRLDSEKIPVENEMFSMHEMFDSLYSTFAAEAAKRNVFLYPPTLNPDIPDKIYHDKGKIRQVISGFIENAIKYTVKGSIEMDCELVDNQLIFWVKDTGIGIGPKDQKRVFDRFFRANEVQIKAIRGNGLGLSIAKGLIELIGGTIGLQSEPGVGTKFFFNIPLLKKPEHYEKPSLTAHGISNWITYNILIVEDEPDNYNYLVSILQPRVKSVLNATTGEDAIQLVKTNTIHLVLMDLKLPGIDGVEATRAIKSLKPELPVIAVSAFTQNEEMKRAMDAGCTSYITKPLSKEKLFEAISLI